MKILSFTLLVLAFSNQAWATGSGKYIYNKYSKTECYCLPDARGAFDSCEAAVQACKDGISVQNNNKNPSQIGGGSAQKVVSPNK